MSIEPENDKDYLGHTFKDLQSFVSDKMNKSFKDVEQTKSKLDKSDYENQSLRERLKEAEGKLAKRDDKVKREKAKVTEAIINILNGYTIKGFTLTRKYLSHFEIRVTLKGKNLLPLGANSFVLKVGSFGKELIYNGS